MDNFILFKGLREDTIPNKFAGIVLGLCSKFIYYDHPDYKKTHNYYWEDDQCKVVFYDDILENIINNCTENDKQYVGNILRQITKTKNIKLLDVTKYNYQTIIALAKSYIVDSYGVVRDMANNKVENINIPVTRYPLGNHAGLLIHEPFNKTNIKDLLKMSKVDKIFKLKDIKTEIFDNINLKMISIKT